MTTEDEEAKGDHSQEVAKVLVNDIAKATFQQQMNEDLIVSDSDLKNSKTFANLLSTAHGHLDSFVLGVFKSVANDPSSPKDFKTKPTKGLYTPELKNLLVASLTHDMQLQWFPGRTSAKAEALLSQLESDGNKVSDSVSLVAKLEAAPQSKEEK